MGCSRTLTNIGFFNLTAVFAKTQSKKHTKATNKFGREICRRKLTQDKYKQ